MHTDSNRALDQNQDIDQNQGIDQSQDTDQRRTFILAYDIGRNQNSHRSQDIDQTHNQNRKYDKDRNQTNLDRDRDIDRGQRLTEQVEVARVSKAFLLGKGKFPLGLNIQPDKAQIANNDKSLK